MMQVKSFRTFDEMMASELPQYVKKSLSEGFDGDEWPVFEESGPMSWGDKVYAVCAVDVESPQNADEDTEVEMVLPVEVESVNVCFDADEMIKPIITVDGYVCHKYFDGEWVWGCAKPAFGWQVSYR